MLDVERRPDVDPGVEQFLDVLPAFGWRHSGALVWASSSTMMSFGRRRSAPSRSNSSIRRPCDFDDPPRQDFETTHQSVGFGAAVGFDEADDDIDALLFEALRALPASHRSCRRRARRR